jgi:hypothetical protein
MNAGNDSIGHLSGKMPASGEAFPPQTLLKSTWLQKSPQNVHRLVREWSYRTGVPANSAISFHDSELGFVSKRPSQQSTVRCRPKKAPASFGLRGRGVHRRERRWTWRAAISRFLYTCKGCESSEKKVTLGSVQLSCERQNISGLLGPDKTHLRRLRCNTTNNHSDGIDSRRLGR